MENLMGSWREKMSERKHKHRAGRAHLQLLIRVACDKRDYVPLGAKHHDEGEQPEGEHAGSNGEGRRADVPA